MLKKIFPKFDCFYQFLPVLGSILDDFANYLVQLGYSLPVVRYRVRAVRVVDRKLQKIGCDKISKISQADLQACVPIRKSKTKSKVSIYSTIKLLRQYFDDRGVLLSQGSPSTHTAVEVKIKEYKIYLNDVRGLKASTIHHHSAVALQFIEWFNRRGGLLCLSKLTLQDIEEFVRKIGRGNSRDYLKHLIISLRSFLRYLVILGDIPAGIDSQIDTPRIYQGERLPKVLSWEIVQALLKSIDRSTAIGKRDFAILLLIATYGLRASEVVDLKLDNINWRANCFQILQRKTGTSIKLPLTSEVGRSIMDYLQKGRPSCSFREIFLRHHAPHGALKPTAVSEVFQNWSRRSGLPISFQGVHCLRFSYAVHLIRQGVSIKTIGDILGHRSFESTYTYLRLSIEDLRAVPLNLPIQPKSIQKGVLQ
jgi:site-specific recombinase XerD